MSEVVRLGDRSSHLYCTACLPDCLASHDWTGSMSRHQPSQNIKHRENISSDVRLSWASLRLIYSSPLPCLHLLIPASVWPLMTWTIQYSIWTIRENTAANIKYFTWASLHYLSIVRRCTDIKVIIKFARHRLATQPPPPRISGQFIMKDEGR